MSEKKEIMLIDLLFNKYLEKLYTDEKFQLSIDDESKIIEEFTLLIENYFSNIDIDIESPIDKYYIDTLEYTIYKGVLDFEVNKSIFLSNLEANYAQAFHTSDALYILSMEVGKIIFHNREYDDKVYNEVLNLIHMKACQIYAEITTLVKNGYGTGAMARYRSLYEISIVFEYILQKGEKAAEAYLDYLIVADMKDQKLLEELYDVNYIKNEELTTTFYREKEQLIKKYDKQFVNLKNSDYVWAYYTMEDPPGHNLGIKQLRKEINRTDGQDYYKLASNIIHASTKSVFSDLGNPYRNSLAGGSNTGISQPIILASYDMMLINTSLLNKFLISDNVYDNLKDLFTMKTNYVLYKEIEETYTTIQDEILNEFSETGSYRSY